MNASTRRRVREARRVWLLDGRVGSSSAWAVEKTSIFMRRGDRNARRRVKGGAQNTRAGGTASNFSVCLGV